MQDENVSKKADLEYSALRSEIIAWIQVEYSLTAGAATMTMIALGFFEATAYWPFYSSVLLGLLAAINGLVSFARAKINQTSAYLIVFHDNPWEIYMRDLVQSRKNRITTTLHSICMSGLFLLLGVASVAYPFAQSSTINDAIPLLGWILLSTAIVVYIGAFYAWWCSYDKKGQIKYWEDVRNESLGKGGKLVELPIPEEQLVHPDQDQDRLGLST